MTKTKEEYETSNSKLKELNDEDLKSVAGGASGRGASSIYGVPYTTVEANKYYCGDEHPRDYASILFVTEVMTGKFVCEGIREKLRIDANNNWHTEFVIVDHYTASEMQTSYPYVLNIEP